MYGWLGVAPPNSGHAFTPSQAAGLIVTCSCDTSLRVWSLPDGACLRTLTGPTAAVYALVDVGGGCVACAGSGADSILRVWDVLSGEELQQIPTGPGGVRSAAALWGDRVATGHVKGHIRLWRLADGGGAAGELQGHTDTVTSLVVVRGGGAAARRLLASGSGDCSIRLWDADVGACTAVLAGHTRVVSCMADLGGGRLLSGSMDSSLRVWDALSGSCVASVQDAHGEPGFASVVTAACATPGGAVTGALWGTVRRWRWDEGASALRPDGQALRSEGGRVWRLVASPGPDGVLRLLSGCEDGSVRVLSAAGGELAHPAPLCGHTDSVTDLTVMMGGDEAICC